MNKKVFLLPTFRHCQILLFSSPQTNEKFIHSLHTQLLISPAFLSTTNFPFSFEFMRHIFYSVNNSKKKKMVCFFLLINYLRIFLKFTLIKYLKIKFTKCTFNALSFCIKNVLKVITLKIVFIYIGN